MLWNSGWSASNGANNMWLVMWGLHTESVAYLSLSRPAQMQTCFSWLYIVWELQHLSCGVFRQSNMLSTPSCKMCKHQRIIERASHRRTGLQREAMLLALIATLKRNPLAQRCILHLLKQSQLEHLNSPNISVMHFVSRPPPSSSLTASAPKDIFAMSLLRCNTHSQLDLRFLVQNRCWSVSWTNLWKEKSLYLRREINSEYSARRGFHLDYVH